MPPYPERTSNFMSKIITTNSHWCDADHMISTRLRTELLNTNFTQKAHNQLQIIINAHVTPSHGVRVDIIERRRRKNG